jgi:hypothetical protein
MPDQEGSVDDRMTSLPLSTQQSESVPADAVIKATEAGAEPDAAAPREIPPLSPERPLPVT